MFVSEMKKTAKVMSDNNIADCDLYIYQEFYNKKCEVIFIKCFFIQNNKKFDFEIYENDIETLYENFQMMIGHDYEEVK